MHAFLVAPYEHGKGDVTTLCQLADSLPASDTVLRSMLKARCFECTQRLDCTVGLYTLLNAKLFESLLCFIGDELHMLKSCKAHVPSCSFNDYAFLFINGRIGFELHAKLLSVVSERMFIIHNTQKNLLFFLSRLWSMSRARNFLRKLSMIITLLSQKNAR